MNKKMLITGSCGLIGSEAVEYFIDRGWTVYGVDNNMRKDFFGEGGSTDWRREQLERRNGYVHSSQDVRWIRTLVEQVKPDAVIHCAGQPSHDLAAQKPDENWDVNVTATVRLLEACRKYVPEAAFVFMSSNKVYGDRWNDCVVEHETRYSLDFYTDGMPMFAIGFDEFERTDSTCRSIYGASKLAADVAVQEYGSYFGMPTVALRCACMTGPNHSGVALHGFLSYMVKCAMEGTAYNVNNYKGKQVRDNIHALDVIAFMEQFIEAPRAGEVYNIGGGRGTDISILEARALVEAATGKTLELTFNEHARKGDFIVWITDTAKARRDYPKWQGVTIGLEATVEQIVKAWETRLRA